jgi:inosine/xanthosine triphosphate pyrophosphatase family protein
VFFYIKLVYNQLRFKRKEVIMKILFATGNPSKAKRFSTGLAKHGIEVISLKDIDVKVDVKEDGADRIENALIKARAYAQATGMPTIGMDDNLYLVGVPEDKQPGMFVRRIDKKHEVTDEELLQHFIDVVKEFGTDGKLDAKWLYGMALISNGKEYTYTWEKGDMYFVDKQSDVINPGYPLNSISINKTLGKYFTDMTEEDKETIKQSEDDVVEFIVNSLKDSGAIC